MSTSLVDTASNGKKFCFCAHDVYCMINCLYQREVMYMYMRNRCSDVFLDTSISYDNGVKIVDDGLGFYFSLVIFILFYFSFSFHFLFLE